MSRLAARQHEIEAALRMAEDPGRSSAERADMLVEIAMGLQSHAQSPEVLQNAVDLYERALDLLGEQPEIARARVLARKATALQSLADSEQLLAEAREIYAQVEPVFARQGLPAERAELQMNLGLVLQTLAGAGGARMADAIRAYQLALRHFSADEHPREYAILHNNLATAFLALPTSEPQGRLREALAVQSFEAALEVITLEAQPLEYAMLQNNLGNALQQVESSKQLENHARALHAYDEALRVRSRDRSPMQFASTMANRAACLAVLALRDGASALQCAREAYEEAAEVFAEQGDTVRAQLVQEALQALPAEVVPVATVDE